MKKINLSGKQKEIVLLEEGAYLVTASAGSGKTRVLTERIKRLSEKTSKKILAITFTNKASEEIRERLGNNEKIKKQVFVGTFHSFCQSILELRFKNLGYEKMPHIFEDDSDRIELIKSAINSVPDFKKIYDGLEPKKKNSYVYNALQFISTLKRDLISFEEFENAKDINDYKYLYELYQDLLKFNNAIDFDDIVKLIYDLFVDNEPIANIYRKSYSYICIDECQDLNKLQYFFLKVFCGESINNVMMVGDSNQSIYGFNGSSSSYMEKNFLKDFNAKRIVLEENYRSSKSVIEASNKLMNLDIEAVNYVIKGIFEINELGDEDSEAKFVLNKIKELVELKKHDDIEGDITFDRIGILARNKFVFNNIEQLFKQNKIPFYYKSGNNVTKFSSSHMRIFDLYFRVKINPLDKLHLNKLETFLKVSDINNEESIEYPIATDIINIIKVATIDNFHLKIEDLEILFSKIVDENEKNLVLNELKELKNQFLEYKRNNIKKSLAGFKSAMALGIVNKKQEETGICLSTVHTMKGQEKDIIFLIGMDDGTFPDYRATSNEDLKQEKNNTYVAFTRAKRFLYVTYPRKRLMPWGKVKEKEMSRFIKPLFSDK